MTDTYIRTWQGQGEYLEHLNGVDWVDAPLPRRWHRCWAQTRGWFGLNIVERCACGAAKPGWSNRWINKNERRRERRSGDSHGCLPRGMGTQDEFTAWVREELRKVHERRSAYFTDLQAEQQPPPPAATGWTRQ
jgi:hypothetical protein